MKKLNLNFLIYCLLGLFLASCSNAPLSITKRHYRSGWFVQTKGDAKTNIKASQLSIEKEAFTETSAGNENAVATENANITASAENAIIALQNTEKSPLITSVTNNILTEKKSPTANNDIQKMSKKEVKKAVKMAVKEMAPPAGGGKSWLVALLLCIFVGGIGIHRFYLGYTTIGIIQLLTLGGCGVWALIDLIRIVIRDLKPKDGDYTD